MHPYVCLSISLSLVHALVSSELISDKADLRPGGKVLKATMLRQNVCRNLQKKGHMECMLVTNVEHA